MRFYSIVIALSAIMLHGCKDSKKSKSKNAEANVESKGEATPSTQSDAKTSDHTQV